MLPDVAETSGPNYWMGVVHRDHALRGVSQGIVQTNHGAKFGVARMAPGDGFVFYSPKDVYPDGHSLRAFTAIGIVAPGGVWQADISTGSMRRQADFRPWRRKVDWDESARPAPITPLLDVLELTRGIRNWGLQLQKGHLALTEHDFRIIAHEMGADSVLAQSALT
jgi:hypothetical protein